MGRAEGIVGAFRTLGETAQAAALAQGADAIAAPGQDLVRIALVTDVPDDDVVWRIEHMMQRHGQFDHAQGRTQMAAGLRHHVDRLGAHLVRQRLQLRQRQVVNRLGVERLKLIAIHRLDGVENGSFRRHILQRNRLLAKQEGEVSCAD